ncbi:MAG: energy transducer TonB [Bacteroidetes bacterium]|nr:energy transducer TonB [Bacteroidota bacterium]MCA6445041.1 energy transducer TonB [Bacteroidota bacterium]
MKTFIWLVLALNLGFCCISKAQLPIKENQDLYFDVWVKEHRPIKKEALLQANTIADVIPGYPVNWISDYSSIEITTVSKGTKLKAVSSNSVLTAEQKKLLNNLMIGSELIVEVFYAEKNDVTKIKEPRKMHTEFTISPEMNASYVGGMKFLMSYLKENAINKIPKNLVKTFKQSAVIFTVNEEGVVTGSTISKTTGDKATDRLLLDALSKMPKWMPAKTKDGKSISQVFEFTIRSASEGC